MVTKSPSSPSLIHHPRSEFIWFCQTPPGSTLPPYSFECVFFLHIHPSLWWYECSSVLFQQEAQPCCQHTDSCAPRGTHNYPELLRLTESILTRLVVLLWESKCTLASLFFVHMPPWIPGLAIRWRKILRGGRERHWWLRGHHSSVHGWAEIYQSLQQLQSYQIHLSHFH